MDPMDPMDEDSPAEDHGPPERRLTDASSNSATTTRAPASSAHATSSASATSSKRRRGLGVVTPNACTECRKKRAKCDGQRPCGRCKAQKDVECVYEVPVRQSKENLRAEIEQLRRQQRSNDSVLAALVQPQLYEEVLHRLRNGQSPESISEWLGGALPSAGGGDGVAGGSHTQVYGRPLGPGGAFPSMPGFTGASPNPYTPAVASNLGRTVSPATGHAQGLRPDLDQNSPWGGQFSTNSQSVSTRSNSHPDVMDWGPSTRGPPQSRVGSWVENVNLPHGPDGQRYRGLDQVLAPEVPEMKVPAGTWTNITGDSVLVQHLLALYFCWEYPTFASLSKEHFLKDFREGRHRFCSPILVNAILALGCRFSSQPNTRANADDPHTSGDHFFKECLRLFYEENDHHNLTTIQALGIMSIREASCGRDSESWYYAGQSIRLAIEMGLHQVHDEGGHDDETAVQAATFWGAFALDHAWSLATGSLPQCSCFPHLPPKPAIIDDIEASLWIPYTDDGAPLKRSCEQPSNVRSVYRCFCELSELVHQSLYVLHSPGRPLTSRDLLNIYTQYLNWYDQIPEVLRLGHNFTPAVLFAHMYYHFAILLLFRPLIKLRIVGSAISPRDVCSQAADAIQGLSRSYSQLYTLRQTPSFVPYFVLTSSIMHLAIAAATPTSSRHSDDERSPKTSSRAQQDPESLEATDTRVSESISRGIADLTEMAPCHYFAEQALNILRYLAKKWNIDVKISEESKRLAHEELSPGRDVRPLTSSLNFFVPNVEEQDFICTWGSGKNQTSGVESISTSANSMDNPLFWPFPLQGRPILASGQLLKESGFEML